MLDRLLQSHARIELLKVLLIRREEKFYLRELVKLTRLPQGSVQRELGNLEKAGVILRERSGRQVYFRINEKCIIVPELRSIFVKTVGIADVLKASLSGFAERIEVAFIYGSIAKGTERTESDIDLFIIGDVSFGEIVEAVHPTEEKLGREVNPAVFSSQEFRERIRTGEHFATSIMEETKIFLIRGEDELAGIAE